jgi:hypothetical protein
MLAKRLPVAPRLLSNEHGVVDSEAVREMAVVPNSAAWIAPTCPADVAFGVVNEATMMSPPEKLPKFFVKTETLPLPIAPQAIGMLRVLV